jgi:chromosome segregation ATPase
MSAQPLVLANNKTPASVASDFLSVIKDIEICIENSNSQASAIENRGLFKSAFSSSRKDLVDISRSQNKINEMMLGLIQEVITLNAMSYSFLAAVIGELEQSCRNGWKDSDGQFQQLSDTGRQFADRANDIFVKILDGSKSTQSKIEVNQQNIAELRDKLQLKAEMVLKHTAEIDSIKSTLSNKAMQMQKSQQDISSIQSLLEVKAERLSHLDEALEEKKQTLEQHDKAIHALIEELQENNQMDMARELVIQDMRVQLQTLEQRTRQLKAFTIGLSVTCLALTSLTALSLFKLF